MVAITKKIEVLPESLVWARERSGFDAPTAAKRLGIKLDSLMSMEAGETDLSPTQIRKLAGLYRVSPAVFFFSRPPTEQFKAPRDFRSLPESQIGSFSPELRKEIDRARSQISRMKELSTLRVIAPIPLDLKIHRGEPVEELGSKVRLWCESSMPAPTNVVSDPRRHFAWWSGAIEERGVIVAQVSRISLEEMRGFCLGDDQFPIIVINGADSWNGRLFTLLHELAHVLLGIDGISNAFQSGDKTEVFCNAVAAATLVPREELRSHKMTQAANATTWWELEDLATIASELGASREVILRRLLTLGLTSRACFEKLQASLHEEYAQGGTKKKSTGGPAHDVMLLRNLGRHYVSSVIEARNRGAISQLEASDFLFSKVRWVDALERRLAGDRS